MLKDILGRRLRLKVIKATPSGFFLEKDGEEFFLIAKMAPQDLKVGDETEVFLFRDSEDRLSATTALPLAMAGEFRRLRVRDESPLGWFLDWGLPKDLLLPKSQVKNPPSIGQRILVYVYFDEKGQSLAATTLYKEHLLKSGEGLVEGQKGTGTCLASSDAGFTMAFEGKWMGLVFREEINAPLMPGQERTLWVKKIRPDGKVDLTLRDPDLKAVLDGGTQVLLKALEKHKGFLPLHDKSPPEEVRSLLGISKKDFKKAAGILYKQKLIKITDQGLEKL